MKSFNQFLIDISEAAGDPIKPEQVIKLGKTEQQNIKSAERKPTPTSPQQNKNKGYNFMSRYIRNTSYLFPTPL